MSARSVAISRWKLRRTLLACRSTHEREEARGGVPERASFESPALEDLCNLAVRRVCACVVRSEVRESSEKEMAEQERRRALESSRASKPSYLSRIATD